MNGRAGRVRQSFGCSGRRDPMDHLSKARQWVEESCKAQGLEPKISDIATCLKVAAVLVEGSDAPDRVQPFRLESVPPTSGATNHNVVKDGGDDGALLMEVEIRPSFPQLSGLVDKSAE